MHYVYLSLFSSESLISFSFHTAKKQSMIMKSESSIQEINAAPRNGLNPASEGRQSSDRERQAPRQKDSLKAKATASSRECYSDGNGEYNGGQLVPFKFSDEELESESDDKLSLRRHRVSNKGGSNKITHCEIEEINNGEFSLERSKEELIYSSDEDGNDDKSALIGDSSEMPITESNYQGAEELNKGNLSQEGAEHELISGSDEEDANKEKSVTAGANLEMEIIGSGLKGVEDLNNSNLPLKDAEEELNSGIDGEDANNDKPVLVGENLEEEVTENNIAGEKLYNGKRPLDKEDHNNDQSAIEDTKSEVDTTEGTTTKNPRTENVDKLDATESRDHSSELSGVLGIGKLSESPITRSSYAYNGRLSSHDGMNERANERFAIQSLDSLKNSYTTDEGRIRKGKGLASSSLYGDLGTQHQSHIPQEKHHVMKESRKNQNKVLENTTLGNYHLMKTKRDHKFPSKVPFPRSGYNSHYENIRPSNRMHDESSSILSHDSHEDTDMEKVKLLRIIYKLQDQLNKTRHISQERNGNSSAAYHSHELHEGKFSHAHEQDSRCNGRCNNHGITWHQRHKYSRRPYSAEETSCVHDVDHFCFHSRSHVSADLSPRILFQRKDLYRSYRGRDCCSSSPQRFAASKLPLYGSETHSNDQRYRATAVRKYLREKPNLAKRHQKPVAGGAPFVTCHKCLNLLQLPADFLLYKRACHKLKCGQCSEVLKFSLKNGSHVVPFSSNTTGLPSSEIHHQSEASRGGNLPSVSHVNYYHYSPAKPISYYDDYELSVSQSYSSEVDPVFLTEQFHHLHGNEYVNPNVSPSSTFKENIASRYSSTPKAPMETDESAEFSSNMSESRNLPAEKVAMPQLRSSPHKLMGYSTPSQVIRGTSC